MPPALPLLTQHLENEVANRVFGQSLAPFLQAGDRLLLSGELGAGKTCLARAIIQALAGEQTDVTSPSFSLLQPYDGPDFPIWHVDLYRLDPQADLTELGLQDCDHALVLIEWPERAANDFTAQALHIRLDSAETGRTLRVSGNGDWPERLTKLTGVG